MSKNIEELYRSWVENPKKFVLEGLRLLDRGYILSAQQEEGLEELRKLVAAKLKKFYKQALNSEELKYVKKIGLSLMSGRGPGKDAFSAWALLWFLFCFPHAKIPCTAPTDTQLTTILWAEVSKWGFRTDNCSHCGGSEDSKCSVCGGTGVITPITKEYLTWQANKIFWKESAGKEWFAFPKTANVKGSPDAQAETLSGFHEEFMMIIIDEASGLPDPVFKPLEGTLTFPVNFVLMIFNPTRNKGYAFDSHHKDIEHWVALHWDAEKSELVSKDHCERMAKKYGRDSNPYRISIRGLPPQDGSDTIIPYEWVEAAVDRDIETTEDDPLIFGIDVARMGNDKSIILKRRGPVVKEILEFTKIDTMKLANWCAQEIQLDEPDAVFIDCIGIGAGVYDRLIEMGFYIHPVNTAETADENEKFINVRAELHWRARKRFEEKTVSIMDDNEFRDELASAKFKEPDAKGRMRVLSKKEMKTEGIPSPNKLDAYLLTLKDSDGIYRKTGKKKDAYDFQEKEPELSWMAA